MDRELGGYGGEDIGDVTKIQPLDAIISDLMQEFGGDQTLFDEVIRRSQMQLSRLGHQPVTPALYFQTLQNNMFPDEMLDFLISLTNAMNYHMDLGGIVVSGVLKNYKEKLEAHRQVLESEEKENQHFVGRKKDIEQIKKIFDDDRSRVKVISICGMGGLGKTSLANKICYTMRSKWHIRKVDLREKCEVLDMLRDVVLELDRKCERVEGQSPILIQETEEEILEQLKEILVHRITHKTLLLLDNMDDILNSTGVRGQFLYILDQITSVLSDQGDQCQMRILMTSRYKLEPTKSITKQVTSMFISGKSTRRHVEEVELAPLEVPDAIALFKNNIKEGQADDRTIEKIIKHCGRSPLAIVTLCSTVRYGISSPYKIIEDLKPTSKTASMSEATAVIACLQQSFDVLTDELKTKLMQLSLFRTAPFDLDAAATVLDEPMFGGKIIGAQTKLDMTDFKSRHMIEVQNTSSETNQPRQQFSFHPLMYHFLNEHLRKNMDTYQGCVQKARIKFIHHYRQIISNIGEEMDKDCIKAQKILSEHRVHVVNFYDVLLEVTKSSDSGKETTETLLLDKRMSELADILLYDDVKFDLLHKWMKEAEDSGNMMQLFQWKIEYAQKMLDVDRNEIVKGVIDELESKFDALTGDASVIPAVLGAFYYLKGRYYVREDMSTEALASLHEAAKLFRIKHVKQNYRVSLANVLNTIGCAHFRAEDYASASRYHQLALEVVSKYCNNYMNLELPTYLHNLGTCLYQEGMNLKKNKKADEAKSKLEEALDNYNHAVRLDSQMNQDKMDCHAQLLKNRAEAKMGMELFDDAEKDMKNALYIRRSTLKPPHVQITINTHKMGELLYRKGVHLYHQGRIEAALNTMYEGVMYYEMTRDLIKTGGMPQKHKEYKKVKEFSLKLLTKTQETQKLDEMKQFFKDFENGVFDDMSKKRRSEKATLMKTLTRKEIMGIVSVGPSNKDSTSDDVDDEIDDIIMEDEPNLDKDVKHGEELMLNFTEEEDEKMVDFDSFLEKIRNRTTDNEPATIDTAPTDSGHTQTERSMPRQLPRQGSSVDEVFGNPLFLPQKSVIEVASETQSIVEQNIKDVQKKRQEWQDLSMQTTSLETSFEASCEITPNEYLGRLRNQRESNKLAKMHHEQAIDEEDLFGVQSDEEDDMEILEAQPPVADKGNEQIDLKTHQKPDIDDEVPQKRKYTDH